MRQDRIALVLSAVEESLYTSKVEAISVPKKLSIEHLMPQTWEEHWPLPEVLTPEEREAALAARSERIHRLGNLTIVTLALNSAMSNAAWQTKQKEFNKYGTLLLNSRLVQERPDVFDEAAIDTRGEFLADRILEIWPGPDSWS